MRREDVDAPPTPLRLGVTGHRTFDDPQRVSVAMAAIVHDLRQRDPARPIEVWSSLAEGADRLFVDAAQQAAPRASLVAVLPLRPADYRADFGDAASRADFDRLLADATRITVTGPGRDGTRVSAYSRAGEAVVAGVDVLVAVWDGAPARGPGGTAEIVATARDAGREVIVIPVTRLSDGA